LDNSRKKSGKLKEKVEEMMKKSRGRRSPKVLHSCTVVDKC